MTPVAAYQTSIKVAAKLSVTETDALDDRGWFANHPDCLFRARAELWIVRRRRQGADPDVFLRAFSASIAPRRGDSDGELAPLWYQAAYPDWPAEKCQKWGRKAIKRRGG
jgi:hypothetical protein